MSIRTAIRDMLIEYEHVPDPDNIIYLDTPFARDHARVNAAQAAQLVEDDRAVSRREELKIDLERQRRELLDRLGEIDTALMELHGG